MPFHETSLFTINIPIEKALTRENKLHLADAALADTVLFINHAIEKNKLSLPKFPASFDPTHASRWLYFFLRETIRNSVDAFFAQEKPSPTLEIKITFTTQDKTRQLYLKVKDNGPGFAGIEKSMSFTKEPAKTHKEASTCIGGKGFGLSICQEKLNRVIYKNRKTSGATVQTTLGSENSLVLKF